MNRKPKTGKPTFSVPRKVNARLINSSKLPPKSATNLLSCSYNRRHKIIYSS